MGLSHGLPAVCLASSSEQRVGRQPHETSQHVVSTPLSVSEGRLIPQLHRCRRGVSYPNSTGRERLDFTLSRSLTGCIPPGQSPTTEIRAPTGSAKPRFGVAISRPNKPRAKCRLPDIDRTAQEPDQPDWTNEQLESHPDHRLQRPPRGRQQPTMPIAVHRPCSSPRPELHEIWDGTRYPGPCLHPKPAPRPLRSRDRSLPPTSQSRHRIRRTCRSRVSLAPSTLRETTNGDSSV